MPELAIVINARNQAGPALESLNKQLDMVESRVGSMRETLGNAGRSMQQVGGMATLGLSLPIAGIGMAAINAASDLAESTNKINVIFEDGAASLQKWAEGSALALGQSKLQALDAAATFGIFGKSAGLTGDELTEFSQGFVGLASDLASFNNTSPEDAIEAIGAALRGEAEPMRRYGVLLDDMTMRQKALEMGLVQTTKDALSPQNKVLAASALIWEKTSVAQGDFARTADGLANSQRIVKAQLTEISVLIGERLLPYAQKLVSWALDATKAFTSLTPQMQDFVVVGGVIVAALGPALVVLGTMTTALGALLSPVGAVILAVGALATAFATDFMGIRSAVMPLVTVLTDRFGALSGQLGGGLSSVQDIFGEFSSVISGTGGEFGQSTQHLEGFLEALTGSSQAADLFLGVLDGLGSRFADFRQVVEGAISAIRGFGASAPWQNLVASAGNAISSVAGKLSQLFRGEISLQDLAGSIGQQIGDVISAFRDAVSSADFTEMRTKLLEAFNFSQVDFSQIGQNILNFVSTAVSSIANFDYGGAFTSLASSVAGMVQAIDWSGIGTSLLGMSNTVISTITGFDWGGALRSAGDFAENIRVSVLADIIRIDWSGIVTSLSRMASTVVDTIVNFDWGGALTAAGNFAEKIRSSVADAIDAVDWGSLRENFQAMSTGITQAIEDIDWSVLEKTMTDLQQKLSSLTIKIEMDSGEGTSKISTMTTEIQSASSAAETMGAVWNGVTSIMGPSISRLVGSLGEFISEVAKLVQEFMILQIIAGVVGAVLLGLVNAASSVFSNLGDLLGIVLQEMALVFTSLRDMFGGFIDLVANALGGKWGAAWEGAKQVVVSIAGFIGSTLGLLAAFVGQIGVTIGDLISTTMKDLGFTEIAAQVDSVVIKIQEFVQLMKDFAANKVNFLIELPEVVWPDPSELIPDFSKLEWPDFPPLSDLVWPEMPEFRWPSLPEFSWPAMPEFKWPTWTWPSLPTWRWPSFPSFEWPDAPWWWPWGGGTPPGGRSALNVAGFRPYGGESNLLEVAQGNKPSILMPAFAGSVTSGKNQQSRTLQVSIGQMIVRKEEDIHEVAYRIADILRRES